VELKINVIKKGNSMNEAKLVVEAVVALIKIGKEDLAKKLCYSFVPEESRPEIEEQNISKSKICSKDLIDLREQINLPDLISDKINLWDHLCHKGMCPFCLSGTECFIVLKYH
jgi:hypothetical protein